MSSTKPTRPSRIALLSTIGFLFLLTGLVTVALSLPDDGLASPGLASDGATCPAMTPGSEDSLSRIPPVSCSEIHSTLRGQLRPPTRRVESLTRVTGSDERSQPRLEGPGSGS